MSAQVVVLGAGYAGVTAVQRLERADADVDLTWVSREDYHLVLHEVHRAVRDPDVADDLTVPVERIAGRDTAFVRGEVVGIDTDARTVALADGDAVPYDYLLVALGSRTAFYGIPGLAEHARTLKSLDDALGIHEAVVESTAGVTSAAPATVLVGGAGLSGIQTAGEVAELRDDRDLPVEIVLVEAMPEVMPGTDPTLQRAVRRRLANRDVAVRTDDPIVEVADSVVHFDVGEPIEADVVVWTGGITGQDALDGAGVAADHNRVRTDATFRTTDERVFAVGDTALVEQEGAVAPPTAQAAWQAGEVAGANVARTVRGERLRAWNHVDRGTVLSVGEDALAHDVLPGPVDTFGGAAARLLKKVIAARWIRDVDTSSRALAAWSSL